MLVLVQDIGVDLIVRYRDTNKFTLISAMDDWIHKARAAFSDGSKLTCRIYFILALIGVSSLLTTLACLLRT